MTRRLAAGLGVLLLTGSAAAQETEQDGCTVRRIESLVRNPTPAELRCRYGVRGPGAFGLLSYLDVPVYRPVTPMPGAHVVGVPGMPRPRAGERYESWEWRVLRTVFGAEVRRVHNESDLLDPVFLSRLRRFDRLLAQRGVFARRRETWRSPDRQAWLFQQGRSRPGPIVTTTLTSWHNRVDRLGRPAARAADYNVAPSQLARFHAAAAEVGLQGYGPDSYDPGHVFWPDEDAAAGAELAVLRLLPRVQHVTLATGRPEGEPSTPESLRRWRLLEEEFVSSRYVPPPEIVLPAPPRPAARVVPVRPEYPAPARPEPGRRRRG